MEQIKKEYEQYETRKEVTDTVQDEFELEFVIDETIGFLEKSKTKILLELLKNKSVREIKKLTSFLFSDDDMNEALNYDEKIIREIKDHIDTFIEYLKRIKEVLTAENFKELLKITDFLIEQYISNLNALQSKRKRLENSLMGIDYIDGKNKDTREEFKNFFDTIIRKYGIKPVEMKKDI